MLYTYPHYYKKFQCIASECEDTCCAGWAITIDPKSLEKYRHARGPGAPERVCGLETEVL